MVEDENVFVNAETQNQILDNALELSRLIVQIDNDCNDFLAKLDKGSKNKDLYLQALTLFAKFRRLNEKLQQLKQIENDFHKLPDNKVRAVTTIMQHAQVVALAAANLKVNANSDMTIRDFFESTISRVDPHVNTDAIGEAVYGVAAILTQKEILDGKEAKELYVVRAYFEAIIVLLNHNPESNTTKTKGVVKTSAKGGYTQLSQEDIVAAGFARIRKFLSSILVEGEALGEPPFSIAVNTINLAGDYRSFWVRDYFPDLLRISGLTNNSFPVLYRRVIDSDADRIESYQDALDEVCGDFGQVSASILPKLSDSIQPADWQVASESILRNINKLGQQTRESTFQLGEDEFCEAFDDCKNVRGVTVNIDVQAKKAKLVIDFIADEYDTDTKQIVFEANVNPKKDKSYGLNVVGYHAANEDAIKQRYLLLLQNKIDEIVAAETEKRTANAKKIASPTTPATPVLKGPKRGKIYFDDMLMQSATPLEVIVDAQAIPREASEGFKNKRQFIFDDECDWSPFNANEIAYIKDRVSDFNNAGSGYSFQKLSDRDGTYRLRFGKVRCICKIIKDGQKKGFVRFIITKVSLRNEQTYTNI